MQNNKLLPLKRKFDENDSELPLDKMRSRLDRHTKYWPITISSTFIFNLRNVSYSYEKHNNVSYGLQQF